MINCIAIDDEPLALKQMVAYIERTPFLNLIGEFESAISSLDFLQDNDVDLMFVDINMPDLNGMDFIKSFKDLPNVIFTTAYSDYAIEGFRVDAIDYLLKPISYSEFLRAAEKAKDRIKSNNPDEKLIKSNENYLFIKSDYKIIRINFSDIKYIEAMREYLRIHVENQKPIMTLMSMKKIDEFLPDSIFMRVHRSYIVNLNKINTIDRNRIIFDGTVYIPISEQYKHKFQEYLNDNFLL